MLIKVSHTKQYIHVKYVGAVSNPVLPGNADSRVLVGATMIDITATAELVSKVLARAR